MQSGGRSRTSDSSERDGQQGDENRANRHQGQHSRESREEFYRRNQTGESNNNSPGPTVPEPVTPMSPAILRPSIIRHSVTGLRIPRVGSISTSTMERRIPLQTRRSPIPSPVPQAMRPGIETSGHISTVLGQPHNQQHPLLVWCLQLSPIQQPGQCPLQPSQGLRCKTGKD